MSTPSTIVYASRFGATSRLAERLAAGMRASGATVELLNVDAATPPPETPLILLTSIIWDRPLPAMRAWLADHAGAVRERTVACGVVCGAAGVREGGGMIYAGNLARRLGRPQLPRFALSGELPPRAALKTWEWWALRAFATAMRKPQLFAIAADLDKAERLGKACPTPDDWSPAAPPPD